MIIYKFTNILNNKIYIGLSRRTQDKRYNDHVKNKDNPNDGEYNSIFHRALRKYGVKNFEFEIIDNAKNLQELSDKEIYWIKFYDSTNRDKGYNLHPGGIKINSDSFVYWDSLTEEEKQLYKDNMAILKQGIQSKKSKHTSVYIGVYKIKNKKSKPYCTQIYFQAKNIPKLLKMKNRLLFFMIN